MALVDATKRRPWPTHPQIRALEVVGKYIYAVPVIIVPIIYPQKNICIPVFLDDLSSESVEVLRERLTSMKKLMADRTKQQPKEAKATDIFTKPLPKHQGIIDGNFLNMAFGGALLVIVSVSVYAFYHLYHAILKKFPSHHTEL